MDIKDLDEYQGLTAEMLSVYLNSSPRWALRPSGALLCGKRLVWPQSIDRDLAGTVSDVACAEGRTGQALLREINPRLRKGKPSPEARLAHSKNGGVWIATHGELGNDGSIVFASFDESRLVLWNGEGWDYPDTELTETLPEWSFWPCDAAGNKVRWPEKDGVML